MDYTTLKELAQEFELDRSNMSKLREELTEAQAENDRLAGEYQDAADEICAALGVEWTPENRYPTVAAEAIERLRQQLVELQARFNRGIVYSEIDETSGTSDRR